MERGLEIRYYECMTTRSREIVIDLIDNLKTSKLSEYELALKMEKGIKYFEYRNLMYRVPFIYFKDVLNVFPINEWYYSDKLLMKIREEETALKNKQAIRAGEVKVNVPDNLKNSLFDYQMIDAGLMKENKRVLNANDIGCGKTLEVLATAEMLKDEVDFVLIVCPATIKFAGWEKEIRKWLGEGENSKRKVIGSLKDSRKYVICDSPVLAKRLNLYKEKAYYYVVNYDLIWRGEDIDDDDETTYKDFQAIQDLIKDKKFLLVADEAHYLKNTFTNRSRAFVRIASKADRVILITATPLMNDPTEVYSLVSLLDNAIFKNVWWFKNKFCITDNYGKVLGIRPEMKGELKDILKRVAFRRKLRDIWTGMPKRIEQVREVELTKHQKKMYNDAIDELRIWLSTGEKINIVSALAKIMRLKQITTGAFTLDPNINDSAKIDECERMLPEILSGDNKCVIFTQFVSSVDEMARRFAKYNPLVLKGGLSSGQKQDIQQQFMANNEHKILLMTTAGVEGIDLYRANYMVFIDRLFTPSRNDQIEGRILRTGQTRDCVFIVIKAIKTIDSRIDTILQLKRELFNDLVNGIDGGLLKGITEESVKKLIEELIKPEDS